MSHNLLVSEIKIYLNLIDNKRDRETCRTLFNKNSNNIEKIKKLHEMISGLINIQQGIIDSPPPKEPVYETPPTFEDAVSDFLNFLSEDMKNIPDLIEYYSELEVTAFDVDNITGRSRKKSNKTTRYAKAINTIVKKDICICSADCQSGKTKFSICLGIKTILEGKIPIYVVRDLKGDANKLKNDIELINKQIAEFINKNQITQKFEIQIIKGDDKKSIGNITSDKNIFKMVVCLGNETQLTNIYENFKQKPSSFVLIIDEIDYVDYGTSNISNILKLLKKLSYQTFGVTATPLDCLFSEEDIKSANNIRLKVPDDYRGFLDIQVKLLETDPDTSALNVKSSYAEILNSDKNLEIFLNWFSNRKADFAWKIKKYIPNIALIKNSNINDNQDCLFEGISKNYLDKVVVIVYNGVGISINYKNMPSEIIIKNTKVYPKKYAKIDIPDVLQYLKDNGGVKTFPRIIIISGILAGRCISYVSRDYDWHLTDMYYNASKTATIPDMIQSCGRLCGRNKGKSHLYLHVTKRVADALYDGFNFTSEIVTRAIASPLIEDGEEVNFSKSMLSVTMNNKKYPTGRKLVSKVDVKKKDFNLVKTDDGGKKLEEYNYNLVKEKENDDGESKEDEINDEIKRSREEIGNDEYERLTKIFVKWSKDDKSKIAKFMHNLDPHKEYSEIEMKQLCQENSITNMSHLMIFNREKSKGYGKIIKKNNNKYILYACLIETFKKCF